MVFAGKDALLRGAGFAERAEQVYRHLLARIANATRVHCTAITLVLTEGRPVEFSDGEYLFIRPAGVLIIRVNGQLHPDEQVRVFFRELAEFMQRCENGFCITKEVWELHAPREYNRV